MVGAGAQPQPQQQQSQPHPMASAAATTASAEEEALKRNTDCVYFLASPLTCKKGSECEYRHSDIARVNPRDCWFWLNGNCLNPKCGFRHPPLDGLLGTQVPTPLGSALPPSQAAAAPAPAPAPAAQSSVSGKQGVPCIFFQKGYCLKGDRCPFLHGPSSVNNKVPQVPAATSTTEVPLKKAFGSLEKCTQAQKGPQINALRSADLLSQPKPVTKVETAAPKNGDNINKRLLAPSGLGDGIPGYGTMDILPAGNENSVTSNRVHQANVPEEHAIQNGKDTDEHSREPSPGFDVLVDDELGESDYYQNEDQFGRRGHEGRNLNLMDEYDLGRSADYNSMTDVDREMYRDPRGYDSYDSLQGQFAWEEQRRVASERTPMGSAHLESMHYRAESPDQIDESDLRYHLSKHRRVNGLGSVIGHNYARENHTEDRNYQHPIRESSNLPPLEGSRSSRLRGRIRIPGRSASPVNGSERWSERDMNEGRSHARLSPGRPPVTSHRGRLRDRLKGRMQENLSNDGRSIRNRIRRDVVNDNDANFGGPKSLAELNVGKNTESSELIMSDQQSVWKKRYSKLEGHQRTEGDISFEGPKPLSEILKRKRGVAPAGSGSGINQTKMKSTATIETQSSAKAGCEEGEIDGAADIPFDTDKGNSTDGQSSLPQNSHEPDAEYDIVADDVIEDHETEYDQREGDYDYDQDGVDYNLYEGDNADPNDEYLDDDDDEFAKKMGVTYP